MQPVASGANRQTLVLMWKTSLLWPQTQWLPLRCWSKKPIQNKVIHLNGYNAILWYIKVLMLWKIRFNILKARTSLPKKSIICIQAPWNVFLVTHKTKIGGILFFSLSINYLYLSNVSQSQLKHICSSWRCEVRIHWHTNQSLAVHAILVSGIDKLAWRCTKAQYYILKLIDKFHGNFFLFHVICKIKKKPKNSKTLAGQSGKLQFLL